MKFKFADSISAGMDLQTIPPKAIINQVKSSKQSNLNPRLSLLSLLDRIEKGTFCNEYIVKRTTQM